MSINPAQLARLSFQADGHAYTLDGKPIPSVSAILKSLGNAFYARTPQAMASLDRGSRVHQATEIMDALGMGPLDFEPDLAPYLTGWQQFITETGAQVREIEQTVFSEKLWFAGTFDRIITIFGRFCLIDIKTGGKQKTHPIQLAAYAVAWEELTGEKIDYAGIVYLKDAKKRKYSFDQWRDDAHGLEPFQPYKDTWRRYCADYRRNQ
jgi:hypothetical protein